MRYDLVIIFYHIDVNYFKFHQSAHFSYLNIDYIKLYF